MGFTVAVTPTRPDYTFAYEREALDPIGAELLHVQWENETQYTAAIADADANQRGASDSG